MIVLNNIATIMNLLTNNGHIQQFLLILQRIYFNLKPLWQTFIHHLGQSNIPILKIDFQML